MNGMAKGLLALAAGLLLACGGGMDVEPASREVAEQEAALCAGYCGDNLCNSSETYTCPADCGVNVCGDRRCCNETPDVCPEDCPFLSNFCYFTPDTLAEQGGDASRPPLPEPRPRFTAPLACIVCGDSVCDSSETYTCAADCGVNVCGDHRCCRETPSQCPEDCTLPPTRACYFTPDL